MLCKLTHSAGRVLAIYHIVIFECSHVTVRNMQARCRVDAPFEVDSLLFICPTDSHRVSANQFLHAWQESRDV